MYFLMGLNDSFSQLRSKILSRDPFPPFPKIFSLILQEERQRDIGSIPTFFTPMSETPSMLAHAAQGPGHRSRDKLFCTHCHKTNHTIDKYFQYMVPSPPVLAEAEGVVLSLM